MPTDSIGVIVFTIGDHTYPLYNTITFNIYERLLELEETPWSERRLADRINLKKAGREGRSKVGFDRVENTRPSHALQDYTGEFGNEAYGIIKISMKDGQLQFAFQKFMLPLSHYHYDRFDSPDDEIDGKWSLNFVTNPQGEINKVVISLDEGEVIFSRKADASMYDPVVLANYTGNFEFAGYIVKVFLKDNNKIFLSIPGQPDYELVPIKKDKFRFRQFADIMINFIYDNESINAFEYIDPSGVYKYTKK